ncbi:MAG TPA: hypothetical protein VGK44_17655, partial [Casimicrobiaceae bacterium]
GANGTLFASVSFALTVAIADCVTVLGRLPVRAVASALRDQLQIAIESWKPDARNPAGTWPCSAVSG